MDLAALAALRDKLAADGPKPAVQEADSPTAPAGGSDLDTATVQAGLEAGEDTAPARICGGIERIYGISDIDPTVPLAAQGMGTIELVALVAWLENEFKTEVADSAISSTTSVTTLAQLVADIPPADRA